MTKAGRLHRAWSIAVDLKIKVTAMLLMIDFALRQYQSEVAYFWLSIHTIEEEAQNATSEHVPYSKIECMLLISMWNEKLKQTRCTNAEAGRQQTVPK